VSLAALPYRRIGPAAPASPVILSVPHAGRDYPAAIADMLRVPREALEALEDRHVDRLADAAAASGISGLVATVPRAWIDLNRADREIDPDMIEPPLRGAALIQSAKVRGGLGLVPRRLHPHGDIWKGRLPVDSLTARIRDIHRPYHEALSALLTLARARFGAAVLLDLHSMPPIRVNGGRAARIVIGDRFGRSATARITARAVAEAREAGFVSTVNTPYAGGHILERHGDPVQAVHAIQVEIDRSLYLAPGLREPGPGMTAMSAFVARLAAALADEISGWPMAIAAE